MSSQSGANKTPLGRFNPTFGASRPSGSLLRPDYMGPSDGYPQIADQGMKREFEPEEDSNGCNSQPTAVKESREERRKKRKSRWEVETDKVIIPGMPTVLPPNLSKEQERIYLIQLQIEEVSRRLRTGDLGIPANPEERSPSPEPIYNNEGKRLNTREFRTRKKLEDERHSLIQQMAACNPNYKPPSDYKAPQSKISEKVLIPQEEYPDINFVGLLIGPRGNTLKSMEKDTATKIIIRGKGSVKEGKIGRNDGQPLPGQDEPLHAFVTGTTHEQVVKAVARIKEVIRQGIEVPENQNDLRRNQLRELALLNGTLRESDGPRCTNCGSSAHRSWQCPDKPNITNNVVCSTCGGAGHIAKDCKEKKPSIGDLGSTKKIDEEYLSLMAELGEGPPPSKSRFMESSYSAPVIQPRQTEPPKAIMASSSATLLPTPNNGQSSSWSDPNAAYWAGQASSAYPTGYPASYNQLYPQMWTGQQQPPQPGAWPQYMAPPPPPPPPS